MRFWEKPKKEFVRDLEFDNIGNPITRIRIRLFIERGKIVNYTVQLEHLIDVWKEVVRFNFSHGFVHKDVYNSSGEQKEKIDLKHIVSLEDAVSTALKDISSKYKVYIDEFRGMK